MTGLRQALEAALARLASLFSPEPDDDPTELSWELEESYVNRP